MGGGRRRGSRSRGLGSYGLLLASLASLAARHQGRKGKGAREGAALLDQGGKTPLFLLTVCGRDY